MELGGGGRREDKGRCGGASEFTLLSILVAKKTTSKPQRAIQCCCIKATFLFLDLAQDLSSL